MSEIKIDFSNAGISEEELCAFKQKALDAAKTLTEGTGAGNDYLGWVDLPVDYDRQELEKIKKAAEKIRMESEVLIVIGIGGSYLGAKAAVDFLTRGSKRSGPQILFAGNSFSTDSIADIIAAIGDRDFSVNVISKSGTTLEPAIAFRVFRELLEKKYGASEAAKRIYATTDKSRGVLKEMADKFGYETFVVPDDIGGRFSVLSSVGLLPLAAAGADVEEILAGAAYMRNKCLTEDFDTNSALRYAAFRQLMLERGKEIEVFCIYNPSIQSFSGWWRQLFGESEGKDGKGLFPACVTYSTDLHSIGQYIQDGKRIVFETMLYTENSNNSLVIKEEENDEDKLNYLAGKTLSYVNRCAAKGTGKAHLQGGTPNIMISYGKKNEDCLGRLFYFFEFACGVSGYMLGVNPFDQPGVEYYKKNMFELLERP